MVIGMLRLYALLGGEPDPTCLLDGESAQAIRNLLTGSGNDDLAVGFEKELDAFPVIGQKASPSTGGFENPGRW